MSFSPPFQPVPDRYCSPGLQQCLAQLLPQCQYAKDLSTLLAPHSDFYLHWNEAEIRLENFYQAPHPDRPLKGVCYELTYQMGNRLQQQWGQSYLFMAADGNCSPFYQAPHTNHTFIVGTPWDHLNDMIDHFQAGNTTIPQTAFLIDPSFQRWGRPEGALAQDFLAGYTIKRVYDFETISPQGERCEVLPFHPLEDGSLATASLPLGLLSQLAPLLLTQNEEPSVDRLAVLGFRWSGLNSDTPQAFLGSRHPAEQWPVAQADWESKLPASHELLQLLTQLRAAMSKG